MADKLLTRRLLLGGISDGFDDVSQLKLYVSPFDTAPTEAASSSAPDSVLLEVYLDYQLLFRLYKGRRAAISLAGLTLQLGELLHGSRQSQLKKYYPDTASCMRDAFVIRNRILDRNAESATVLPVLGISCRLANELQPIALVEQTLRDYAHTSIGVVASSEFLATSELKLARLEELPSGRVEFLHTLELDLARVEELPSGHVLVEPVHSQHWKPSRYSSGQVTLYEGLHGLSATLGDHLRASMAIEGVSRAKLVRGWTWIVWKSPRTAFESLQGLPAVSVLHLGRDIVAQADPEALVGHTARHLQACLEQLHEMAPLVWLTRKARKHLLGVQQTQELLSPGADVRDTELAAAPPRDDLMQGAEPIDITATLGLGTGLVANSSLPIFEDSDSEEEMLPVVGRPSEVEIPEPALVAEPVVLAEEPVGEPVAEPVVLVEEPVAEPVGEPVGEPVVRVEEPALLVEPQPASPSVPAPTCAPTLPNSEADQRLQLMERRLEEMAATNQLIMSMLSRMTHEAPVPVPKPVPSPEPVLSLSDADPEPQPTPEKDVVPEPDQDRPTLAFNSNPTLNEPIPEEDVVPEPDQDDSTPTPDEPAPEDDLTDPIPEPEPNSIPIPLSFLQFQ